MGTDLDIVIVNWNVAGLLAQCLHSIAGQADGTVGPDGTLSVASHRVRVHVVDNASTDGSVRMVQNRFPWVHLLASEVNLGFTGGNNLAIPHAHGRYILLLNPDTELTPGSLAVMMQYAQQHPTVGVLGPRLRYGDGTLQPSRRRFPTLTMAMMESTIMEQWFPNNRWAARYRMEETPEDAVQQVDWLTGACLLTRKDVWDQIGLLDDRFFMYSEELDWCQRAADAGWLRVYLPTAEVVHYEGQSSGQLKASRHILFNASKVLYFSKHHGRLTGEVLRLFLLASFAVQFAEELIKWVLGHKPQLRKSRMQTYAQVIRSGLRHAAAFSREDT